MKKIHTGVTLSLLSLLIAGLMACRGDGKPHSVTLTWKAVPSAQEYTVVGYNIYRSTTSGGQYVKLTRVSGPPYEDRLVNSGRTYFYVVTTMDQEGRESSFSGEVQVEVP